VWEIGNGKFQARCWTFGHDFKLAMMHCIIECIHGRKPDSHLLIHETKDSGNEMYGFLYLQFDTHRRKQATACMNSADLPHGRVSLIWSALAKPGVEEGVPRDSVEIARCRERNREQVGERRDAVNAFIRSLTCCPDEKNTAHCRATSRGDGLT